MKFIKRMLCLIIIVLLVSVIDTNAQRGCCSHHGGVSGSCRNGKQVCNDGTTSPSCTCYGGYDSTPLLVYGCTDSNSINYNPNANRNDGSCIKKVYGCTDVNAYNYNSGANTDDGSCIAKIFGCIDKNANNYNSEANTADGSCLYTKTRYKYKKINYKVKKKYSFFRKEGTIIRKGKKGKRKIKLEEVVDESGNVISSKIINKEIIEKSINKIISTRKKSK